jgi:L-fuculose-phosphate aldolase
MMESPVESLIWCSNAVYSRGLVEAGEGNQSVRVPGADEMLITPTFNVYEGLSGDDISHITFEGDVLGGLRRPSSEYRLHAKVYGKRPGVNCVIHTHSPFASMLSVARRGLPVLLEEMILFLGGPVPVSEYGMANTSSLPENALNAMGDGNAVIMANHGVLVCGRTPEHAVKFAELVEKMSRVFYGASLLGEVHEIPESSWPAFLEKFVSDYSTA